MALATITAVVATPLPAKGFRHTRSPSWRAVSRSADLPPASSPEQLGFGEEGIEVRALLSQWRRRTPRTMLAGSPRRGRLLRTLAVDLQPRWVSPLCRWFHSHALARSRWSPPLSTPEIVKSPWPTSQGQVAWRDRAWLLHQPHPVSGVEERMPRPVILPRCRSVLAPPFIAAMQRISRSRPSSRTPSAPPEDRRRGGPD